MLALVDALLVGLGHMIDVAVLVTGDGDDLSGDWQSHAPRLFLGRNEPEPASIEPEQRLLLPLGRHPLTFRTRCAERTPALNMRADCRLPVHSNPRFAQSGQVALEKARASYVRHLTVLVALGVACGDYGEWCFYGQSVQSQEVARRNGVAQVNGQPLWYSKDEDG